MGRLVEWPLPRPAPWKTREGNTLLFQHWALFREVNVLTNFPNSLIEGSSNSPPCTGPSFKVGQVPKLGVYLYQKGVPTLCRQCTVSVAKINDCPLGPPGQRLLENKGAGRLSFLSHVQYLSERAEGVQEFILVRPPGPIDPLLRALHYFLRERGHLETYIQATIPSREGRGLSTLR